MVSGSPIMLNVYTRHASDCGHIADLSWRRCHCPKWIRGVLPNGDAIREREQEQPQSGFRQTAYGRTGGEAKNLQRPRPQPGKDLDREHSSRARTNERLSTRAIEKWHGLSDRERGTLREIGRFRTISTEALFKNRYHDKPAAFEKEISRLQRQGLLLRRSISVGKNRDTLIIVALTKEAAKLARWDSETPKNQTVYAGFVKPAEVPHDAAI